MSYVDDVDNDKDDTLGGDCGCGGSVSGGGLFGDIVHTFSDSRNMLQKALGGLSGLFVILVILLIVALFVENETFKTAIKWSTIGLAVVTVLMAAVDDDFTSIFRRPFGSMVY